MRFERMPTLLFACWCPDEGDEDDYDPTPAQLAEDAAVRFAEECDNGELHSDERVVLVRHPATQVVTRFVVTAEPDIIYRARGEAK